MPLVADRLDSKGDLPLPYQPVLVRVRDELILVDAGTGPELAAEWEEPVGGTRDVLQDQLVAPSDVQIVVITHAHPDHVGGLTEPSGAGRVPVYANARHILSRTEYAYWRSADLTGPSAQMAPLARAALDALAGAGVLDLVDGDADVAPEVRAFATPGHTPGHMSILLSSEGETALIAGDAILTEWSYEHSDWYAGAEVDPTVTAETRRALIERAAADDWVVVAYHVPGIVRYRAGERHAVV